MSDTANLVKLGIDPVPFFEHDDSSIRRLAIASCSAILDRPGIYEALEKRLAQDPTPRVRAEAAEMIGLSSRTSIKALLSAGDDSEPVVVEAVATALGELGDPEAVQWLIDTALNHSDGLVREAAVASLGAIGDDRALPALLELVSKAPPQVRRRSVAALTVFDCPEVEVAIVAARNDRNPMVREAAEMVVGRAHGDISTLSRQQDDTLLAEE